MIPINQLGDSLSFIMKDDETFEQLKADFPEILADLITFRENPNCTCRGRVVKFFAEQLEKDLLVLNKYVKDREALEAEMQRLADEKQANNYFGKIFVIAKGEEAWREFAKSLIGKTFRSFSIAERDDDVAVYFL